MLNNSKMIIPNGIESSNIDNKKSKSLIFQNLQNFYPITPNSKNYINTSLNNNYIINSTNPLFFYSKKKNLSKIRSNTPLLNIKKKKIILIKNNYKQSSTKGKSPFLITEKPNIRKEIKELIINDNRNNNGNKIRIKHRGLCDIYAKKNLEKEKKINNKENMDHNLTIKESIIINRNEEDSDFDSIERKSIKKNISDLIINKEKEREEELSNNAPSFGKSEKSEQHSNTPRFGDNEIY